MTVAVGNVIKVNAVFTDQFGSQVENVFHLRAVGVTVGTDLAWSSSIADWLDAMYTNINSLVSETFLYTKVSPYNLTTDSPMPEVAWPSLVSGGAGNDEVLPPGAAVLLVGRTGVKRRIGKKYIAGCVEGLLLGGVVDTTYLPNFQSMCDSWVDGVTDILVGSAEGGICAPNGSSFVPLISAFPSTNIAYQRRRRPGRGS